MIGEKSLRSFRVLFILRYSPLRVYSQITMFRSFKIITLSVVKPPTQNAVVY